MPFTFRKSEKLVAFFLITGFFLFIAMVLLIGRGSDIFSFKNRYYTILSETYGFTSGNQIKYKGMNIGKVTSVKLDNDENVKVEFYILRKYRHLIRENTVLKVQSGILGGANFILIPSTQSSDKLLADGSRVLSSDDEEGREILKNYEQSLKKDDLTATAKKILDYVDSLRPVISETVNNIKDITANLKVVAFNLKEVSFELNSTNNTIGGLIKDRKTLDRKLDSIIASIDKTLKNLNDISFKLKGSPEEIKSTIILLQQNLVESKKVLSGIKNILGGEKEKPLNLSPVMGERE
jgi:phospholipid/cholesterol/gamma-HCH transport system substrate-binding protein